MKFKEIKPGMVIHCPTEEDARALLEHLGKEPDECHWNTYEDEMCYRVHDNLETSYGDRDYFKCHTITEFSDLIEPDKEDGAVYINGEKVWSTNEATIKPEMSAKEVLEWLRKATTTKELENLFSCEDIEEIFDYYTNDEIVDAITTYEALKKAPKTAEVECGWHCEITYREEIVSEYGLWGVSEEEAKRDAIEKAKKYTAKTGKTTAVNVWFNCRVKEG